MACNAQQTTAARGRVRQALHKVKAANQLMTDLAGSFDKLPTDPSPLAAPLNALAGQVPPPASVGYDNALGFVQDCPVGQFQVPLYAGWQDADAYVQAHFARQGLRHALYVHTAALLDVLRASDAWQSARIGWRAYMDLKRIGLSRDRVDELIDLCGAARGVDGEYGGYQEFLDTVERPASYVVSFGFGGWQTFMYAIEAVDLKLQTLRDYASARLPSPKSWTGGETVIKRACVSCSEPQSGPPKCPQVY